MEKFKTFEDLVEEMGGTITPWEPGEEFLRDFEEYMKEKFDEYMQQDYRHFLEKAYKEGNLLEVEYEKYIKELDEMEKVE